MFDVIIRRGSDTLLEANVPECEVLNVIHTFAPNAEPVCAQDAGQYAWTMYRTFGADTYSDGEYLFHLIPLIDLSGGE